jgi:hypothetical protein
MKNRLKQLKKDKKLIGCKITYEFCGIQEALILDCVNKDKHIELKLRKYDDYYERHSIRWTSSDSLNILRIKHRTLWNRIQAWLWR